jgi:hypothetical protein
MRQRLFVVAGRSQGCGTSGSGPGASDVPGSPFLSTGTVILHLTFVLVNGLIKTNIHEKMLLVSQLLKVRFCNSLVLRVKTNHVQRNILVSCIPLSVSITHNLNMECRTKYKARRKSHKGPSETVASNSNRGPMLLCSGLSFKTQSRRWK